MEKSLNDMDLMELGDQMIKLRYSLDASHMPAVFRDITISDYLILSNLTRRMKMHEPETKVYLSEISKELNIPISRVSGMVQNLQNKGYVYWEHDEQGTYIYLSETGREAMKKQRDILRTFFGDVLTKMGREEFVKCIDQMIKLEQVMEEEASLLEQEQ